MCCGPGNYIACVWLVLVRQLPFFNQRSSFLMLTFTVTSIAGRYMYFEVIMSMKEAYLLSVLFAAV
jgi:hypothetical protein